MKHESEGVSFKRAGNKSVIVFLMVLVILLLPSLSCKLPWMDEIVYIDETALDVENDKITLELSYEYDGRPYHIINEELYKRIIVQEDGKTVDKFESKLTIEPIQSTFNIILLMDISGSIKRSGNIRMLKQAARAVANHIGEDERISVAVYAFAGRKKSETIQVIDFTSNLDSVLSAIEGLDPEEEKDLSTNLYGAVDYALDILDQEYSGQRSYKNVTALIVLSDGAHLAGTGSDEYPSLGEVLSRINESDWHRVYTVGIGADDYLNVEVLEKLGKNKYMPTPNLSELRDDLKERLDMGTHYYLITYCSPKRIDMHEVTISLDHPWDWKLTPGETYNSSYLIQPDVTPSCMSEENEPDE